MRALIRSACIVGSLVASVASARAQDLPLPRDSTVAVPQPWLVGASIGVPGYGPEPAVTMFTVGAQWTQLDVGRLGADFAVGTAPYAFAKSLVGVGARGGVALPLALSRRVILVPSGGVSLLGAVGHEGGVGSTGFNAGISAVFLRERGTGLRTGLTWHRFRSGREAVWLWEIGFVRGPRRR